MKTENDIDPRNIESAENPAASVPEPPKLPVWTQELSDARFIRRGLDDSIFRSRYPAEAKLLGDYEKARKAYEVARPPAKTVTQRAEDPPHLYCDCETCKSLIDLGYRILSEEDKSGAISVHWRQIAAPKEQRTPEPELPAVAPPALISVKHPDRSKCENYDCDCHKKIPVLIARGYAWDSWRHQWRLLRKP